MMQITIRLMRVKINSEEHWKFGKKKSPADDW